ncbi:C39 family peptidase [Chloroflexota bacterium]
MFETDALYQNDPKWKSLKLGNQNKETIGSWGCLVTSLTMVANGFGLEETPKSINDKMKAAGGFQGALIIPAVLPNVCPGLIYKGYQPCEDSPAPISQINAAIAQGKPVIVQVDWSPKAGLQTHWVVLYDKSGNDYYMKDPYRYSGDAPNKKIKLLDRYTHKGNDIAKAITGVIWIESSNPPHPKPKKALPSDSISVYASVDGLAIRSEPTVTAPLIRRVPLNAILETLENKHDAEAKIGINGQWLHIQDSTGDQGYTAAWYVSKTVIDDDEPEPTVSDVDDIEFYLVPIAEGLALRSAPNYHAQLIKRVPMNTKFGFFDSRAEVNKKVGVVNQWVHVYDESGMQGYTAAWYVTRKAGKPPTPPNSAKKPDKPPEQSKPKEPPAPIEGYAVVPTTDGLAFRSSTNISDHTLIRRLHLTTMLSVEEPEDQAKQKVGIHGQWLKVKDASGQVGYVAAWYVKPAQQSDPGEEPISGRGITIRTTAEGVALRWSPQTYDHTLIKRLRKNSPLVTLEKNAETKIGVYGQWLKVHDSGGNVGFIAAWYVKK